MPEMKVKAGACGWLIGGILMVAVALAGCAAPSASSRVREFKPRRALLADNALDAVVMPNAIGGYSLRPTQGLFPPVTGGQRQYMGIYESLDGREILLTTILNTDAAARQRAINTAAPCADTGEFATAQPAEGSLFSYSACRGVFQFNWTNGNWIMSAATYHKSGIEDLLAFLDAYAY